MIFEKLLLICVLLGTEALAKYDVEQDKLPNVWKQRAKDEIKKKLKLKEDYGVAKNVILFLGDGMSVPTVTSARILKGQRQGNPGEETVLEMDKLPRSCLIKTYTVDRQTTDSASASAAYLGGVKTKYGTIGVDGGVERYKCSTQKGHEITTILNWAKAAGKSVGIVTTARITHASPGGSYAHAVDRNWEDDSKQKSCVEDCTACKDIAKQLIEDNKDINVIFGGGRRHFLPTTEPEGKRLDNRSLINEWIKTKETENKKHAYVTTTKGMNDVSSDTDYVLGLFSASHMDYEIYRDPSPTGQPHIKDMTKKAIELLKKNEKGYFLFVEGARIDHGHHEGRAKKALTEAVAFDDAIGEARKITSRSDTLTVVTADHSVVMTLTGYSKRGNDILGVADPISAMDTPVDGFPMYPTLLYATGNATRGNITNEITNGDEYRQPVAIPMEEGAHGGEDVSLMADGPMSHLFTGVQEQSYIPQVMAYAACVGDFTSCERDEVTCGAASLQVYTVIITTLFMLLRNFII